MIWSLAREQLRSQRRYIAWAAVVVALAVGVATYGALLGATLSSSSTEMARALGTDADTLSYGAGVENADFDYPSASTQDIAAAVAKAQDEGTRVAAHAFTWQLQLEPGYDDGPHTTPVAVIGDIDWDAILLEGAPPATGEVALSADYAQRLGLDIGDEVPLYGGPVDEEPIGMTARVSALTRSSFDSAGLALTGYSDVWLAWDDLPAYSAALTPIDETGVGAYPDVSLYWNGPSAILADVFGPGAPALDNFDKGVNDTVVWVYLATAVLVIGAIAMAFAFGRAQAQSRTQWVATARALGVSRRHVVLATFAEAGVLALLGLVGGYATGWIAATVHLRIVHRDVVGAAIAPVASGPVLVLVGAALLATLLALVVAAVPAFWATRVSPTAALKPENDVTNAQVGRTVKFWPVLAAWAATGVLAMLSADPTEIDGAPLYGVLLWWIFVGVSLVVANEALRWMIPALGGWLSRRPEKSALVAGDSLRARPRQFTVPALLMALGSAALLFASVNALLTNTANNASPDYEIQSGEYYGYVWQTWIFPAAVIVLGSLAVLSTIITAATSAVTARERSTREALGITPGQTRASAAIAQAVALLSGILVGALIGTLLVYVGSKFADLDALGLDQARSIAITTSARAIAIIVGVGAVCTALSAAVTALTSRTPNLAPRVAEAGRVA